jgi:hypothetical protein
MAQDHFVARTYLKGFGDDADGGRLHAYRKSDGAQFRCWPKDVCREWDGDLNPAWLAGREDLLGQFRKIFEPLWTTAVETLLLGSCSPSHKFAIAGYVANLMTCTPGWRRVGVQLYDDHAVAYLSFAKRMQEKHRGDPTLPVEGVAMLERGEIGLTHDPDYVKAVITRQLMDSAWMIYHQDWTVIANSTPYPFLTSDNPVAIEEAADFRQPPARFVAVTPNIGLLMRATRTKLPSMNLDLAPQGKVSRHTANAAAAKHLNKLVARCAEDLVLSSTTSGVIATLVRNAAKFRRVSCPRARRGLPRIDH